MAASCQTACSSIQPNRQATSDDKNDWIIFVLLRLELLARAAEFRQLPLASGDRSTPSASQVAWPIRRTPFASARRAFASEFAVWIWQPDRSADGPSRCDGPVPSRASLASSSA